MQNCNILIESCSVVDPEDIQILHESNTGSAKKTYFKTRLQTLNEVNQNKRMYPTNVGNEIIRQLAPMAKARSLFQEIDHPAPVGDPETSLRRSACVELKNCGAVLRKVYKEGNDVIGEMETLSGFKGPDLRDLITVDKCSIGFSLRMLGRLGKHPTMENIVIPQNPMRAITYDVVSNPSHASARIMAIVTESQLTGLKSVQSEVIEESMLLMEGVELPNNTGIIDEFISDMICESFTNYKPSFSF